MLEDKPLNERHRLLCTSQKPCSPLLDELFASLHGFLFKKNVMRSFLFSLPLDLEVV
jgi:hypothetical protein